MITVRFHYLSVMQQLASYPLLSPYLPALVLFLAATLLSLSNVWTLRQRAAGNWTEATLSLKTISIFMLKRIPKIVVVLLVSHTIAIVSGYLIRDAVLLSRKEQYNDVLIVQRFDEYSYRLEIDQGRFNIKICPEANLDWQPGQRMRRLWFEQKKGCKSIVGNGLGFDFWQDNNGNRILFPVKGENNDGTGAGEEQARR